MSAPGDDRVPVLAVSCTGESSVAAGHVPELPAAELHVHFGVHLGVAGDLKLAPGAELVAHHAGKGGGGPTGDLHKQALWKMGR